jgi:hypothetical protein
MTPIARNEILPIGEYEAIRPHFRARIIEEKRVRRAALSPIMTVIFENRDSVLMQIQEMLRTERITSEDGIAHELETYNELLPKAGQLSMTLFIEIADKAAREQKLVDLAGLEEKVALEIAGVRVPGTAADRSVEGIARTTAIHYFKFDLPEATRAKLASGDAGVAVVCEHPAAPARVELSPDTVKSLARDAAAP